MIDESAARGTLRVEAEILIRRPTLRPATPNSHDHSMAENLQKTVIEYSS